MVTGAVPAVTWHIHMPIHVEVHAAESFADTLERFNQLVRREYERPWTKRRYGYYEPRSVVRRKRAKMRRLQARSGGGLRLCVPIETQLRRSGPSNTAGR
jgi:ribosomal protein S21